MGAPYLRILLVFFVHSSFSKGEQRRNSSYFNDLKMELQEEWGEDNRECLLDLLYIIDGVQNSTLGAAWLWDSLQLPVGVLYGSRYQLGSWAQCAAAPPLPRVSRTPRPQQYCLADVTLTDIQPWRPRRLIHSVVPYNQTVEEYLKTLSPYARGLSVVTWGACVPAACAAPPALRALLAALLRRSTLAALPANAHHITCRAEGVGVTHTPPKGYYLFWFTFVILAAITLFFTNMANSENKTKTSPCIINDVAKAFCIKSNAYALVKNITDDIPCMYGIRSITAGITVTLHVLLFVNAGAVINGLDVDRDIHSYRFILSHSDSIIDTFFFMSGLLTLKGLMSKRHKPENVAVYLLKRYVRFIGGLAISVWYVTSVLQHMGSGPLWDHFTRLEQQYCTKNWFLNLLMVNNYFHVDEICHLVTWYVSADYQLTIVGVLLFYACVRDGRAGRAAVAIFAVLALLLPAAITFWHRMPPTFLADTGVLLNTRKYDVFTERYTRSHYRLGPYMVGMAVGYFLSLYKPAAHRQRINKRQSEFLLVTATVTMFSISGIAGIFHTRRYNVLEAATYCATNRVIWALALGALVMICEYGTPNLISKLLSWRAWVPLSRLSYGLYLTHPLLIQHSVFTAHAPLTHSIFNSMVNGLGTTVVAYVISLSLWVLVEAPLINITNLIFRPSKNPHSPSVSEEMEHSINKPTTTTTVGNGTTEIDSDLNCNNIRCRHRP